MISQASASGKLFLAGEYAVVEPGYPAVIAAVNQRLWVRIARADEGRIHSSQQANLTLNWIRKGDQLEVQGENPYRIISTAMQLVEDYLRALGQAVEGYYSLTVTSSLDDAATGTKYGLGSSGAVTVASIKALLDYYHQESQPLLVFKLAALCQMCLQMTGSFGDLASSSFEGLIAYHSVDKVWLAQKMAELSLPELLEADWQGLSIQSLQLPAELRLLVGWTGKAASTEKLVTQMQQQGQQADKTAYRVSFLSASKACVHKLVAACQAGSAHEVEEAILENRRLLREFAREMGLVIETPLLSRLCQLALDKGAPAKSSGAGGGDCGFCLVTSSKQQQEICQAWLEAGIQPLDLAITYGE
ncbi:phosphomevalonate kinase [Streptococcus oriscaviae]|uniref:phosphomevalonate kinase n=1 Tax=Streptococcus oriscaviae TaxID=2781599 RepID=A0ABX7YKG7_9STRE|nr:phosphomevalonate kinase [Streptococcus oriscaviae]QUE54003.1 phosphomevalonate kinase [Streptococcus oriscaviae]